MTKITDERSDINHTGLDRRKFFIWLTVITLVGLGVRLAYMFIVKWDQPIWGDAFTYHWTANGIADGMGWQSWLPKVLTKDVNELRLPESTWGNFAVPKGVAAENPPLFPFYLSIFSFFGLRSFHWHILATTGLGVASVFMMGLVGRKIGGPRVGLIAAGIAAVYANFWVYDPLVISEPMGILAGTVVVLLAYRAWDEPTLKRVVALGAACGVASLVRSEFALLLVFLMVPFVISRLKGRSIKERAIMFFSAGIVALLVVSPWLIRNAVIFEKPFFMTHDAGLSLQSGNCDATYYGDALGWWSPKCAGGGNPPSLENNDFSVRDVYWGQRGRAYMLDHLDRFPVVALARLGRMWEIYRPGSPWGTPSKGQKITFDIIEGRSEKAAQLALLQYWLLVPFSIAGFILLWKRKRTIVPLIVLPILVSLIAVYSFGNTRYRSIAEIAIAASAAVAFDAILRWRQVRRSDSVVLKN